MNLRKHETTHLLSALIVICLEMIYDPPMEDQTPPTTTEVNPADTAPINPTANPTQTKSNVMVPVLLVLLVSAAVFGIGGYYFGSQPKGTEMVQKDVPTVEKDTVTSVPTDTLTPTASTVDTTDATYTYNSFSISYPKTWQTYDSVANKEFFTANNLTGFDHFVALQNGNSYLVIGIDTHETGAEVGGVFVSDADLQEYLKNHDEILINGEKFFFYKGETSLSAMTDPNRESGIYAFAALSKYIPNKMQNVQGQTANGYDDYFQTQSGSSYMVMKFTTGEAGTTPSAIQKEFVKALQTVHW